MKIISSNQLELILLCPLIIITFTIHQDINECLSLDNSSSKEQFTNINLTDSECFYVESILDSYNGKVSNPYDLDEMNNDLYIKRILKKYKLIIITINLNEYDNMKSIYDDTLINQ